MADAAGLQCRWLTKRFPGVVALDDVSFEVGYGEVVVLLGETGAGKSTLMKLISGVYAPDEGEMTLDGARYRPADPRAAIDAGIGMIHQEMNLLPALSVAENIYLGRQPRRGLFIDYHTMHAQSRDVMQRVGLDVDPARRLGELSIAQQQLTEIAKALSLDAKILILDEPTQGVDVGAKSEIHKIIRQLAKGGLAVLMISSDLPEILGMSDRIAVLRGGSITAMLPGQSDAHEVMAAALGQAK